MLEFVEIASKIYTTAGSLNEPKLNGVRVGISLREGPADTWDGQDHEKSTRIDHENIIHARDQAKLTRRTAYGEG